MKSLQNEYNLIKEGKGNKELFIKEARTLFPNIVTNVLTFDQAIHNLNERGIISEGFTGELSQRASEPNWFKIFSENTEAVKATLKDTDKAVVEKETAGYNYEDKKNNNNISTNELLSGYYAEMKDPKNADKTEDELKKIVFKNLEKDPMYYIKDGAFGVKGIGYTQDAPGLGATKEVTGKYKSSGMEPVKLNEAMYGSSDGDYEADQEAEQIAYYYYDKGLEAYSEGDFLRAENFRRTALRHGSYLGWNDTELPPYDKSHSLEEASTSTANELASYIGVLQKQIKAEDDPKKLKMLKQDLEDTKEELAKKNMTENKHTLSEAKKRAIDKHLAEIDKLGEVAALEYKMGKVQEKIEELKNRLTMTESDDMKDMVDKKAIGEIKKDIAYLEKTKKMYEGKKAKAARKVSGHTAKPQAAHEEEVLDEAQAPVWEQAMKSVLKKRGY